MPTDRVREWQGELQGLSVQVPFGFVRHARDHHLHHDRALTTPWKRRLVLLFIEGLI